MKATVGDVAVQFLLLSFLAVGGVNSILPELHRAVVDGHHWMTASQFADLVALAQAAPGPNMLVATLIGWQVAGLAGAAAATLALCGPTCLLTFAVARVWERLRRARWRAAVEAGLAPLTVGLVLAGGWIVAGAADGNWRAWGVTVAVALLASRTRTHPLLLLGAAGVLGAAGLL